MIKLIYDYQGRLKFDFQSRLSPHFSPDEAKIVMFSHSKQAIFNKVSAKMSITIKMPLALHSLCCPFIPQGHRVIANAGYHLYVLIAIAQLL